LVRASYWFALCFTLVLSGCRTSERVIARADGVIVTERELRERLWQRYGSVTVMELLREELVELEAQRQGVIVSDDEVRQALKRFNLPDKNENRRKVRSDLLLEKLASKMVEVTEAEARQYYKQNVHLYEQPEMVRLRDITLESKENAEAIWKALRLRKGENFIELARHFSTNPVTRQRDGEMGLIPVNDLHPKLQSVVKRLKVGEFSEPIEISGEWVIVKLEERIPPKRSSYEEVREKIIAQLKQQKIWQLKLELPERIFKRSKIQILDPSLKD